MASDPTRNFPAVDPSQDANPCEDVRTLQGKAERCRRLAAGISDRQTSEVLTKLAAGYEHTAEQLKAKD